MTINVWRHDASGFLLVTGPDGVEKTPTLDTRSASVFNARVLPWETLACQAAQPLGVKFATMMGTIYAESLGNANATNSEKPPGTGLTQITSLSLYRGHTRAQVFDPKTNLELCAVHYRKDLIDNTDHVDEPSLASMFNAGCAVGEGGKLRPHPSAANPWGLVCSAAYITTRVAAYNYYLSISRPIPGTADPYSDERVLAVEYQSAWQAAGDAIEEARAARRTLPD